MHHPKRRGRVLDCTGIFESRPGVASIQEFYQATRTLCACQRPPLGVAMPMSSQFRRDPPRRQASAPQFGKDRRELPCPLDSSSSIGRRQPIGAIAAETNAASLCCLQCSLRSRGNHFPLMLGNGRKDMQGQARGMRIIMPKRTRAQPSAPGASREPAGRRPRPDIVHSSIYLPESVYEALREIAFHERCKIHDLIMEGIGAALKKRGYRAYDDRNAGNAGKRPRHRLR
jgi:hypothetical protein